MSTQHTLRNRLAMIHTGRNGSNQTLVHWSSLRPLQRSKDHWGFSYNIDINTPIKPTVGKLRPGGHDQSLHDRGIKLKQHVSMLRSGLRSEVISSKLMLVAALRELVYLSARI